LWLSPATSTSAYFPALWFSIPMVLLVAVAAILNRRFGAAFTGVYGGLALNMPRLSGVLVLALLASIATPVFPAFFVMLKLLIEASLPMMIGVLLIWLLWSWAAAAMIQGLLVGPARDMPVADMRRASGFAAAVILVLLVVAGMTLSGSLP
jgi:NADH:ubiquinone oxidoreductase subunit 4 (subunit M)